MHDQSGFLQPVELDHAPAFLLELVFDDIYFDSFFEDDDTMPVINFSERMAKEIIDFVSDCKDQVDTIICQCELGQSRSAAVAAAVSEWLNGDGIKFFADKNYGPNQFVFRTIYEVLKEDGYVQ